MFEVTEIVYCKIFSYNNLMWDIVFAEDTVTENRNGVTA